MSIKKYLNQFFLVAVLLSAVACDKDEDDNNNDDKYTVPSTYTFVDEAKKSTVSYDGQKQRLDMLSEIVTYLKSANTAGTVITAEQLKKMYANDGFTWTDANDLKMTGSSKQLKSKTAGGDVGIQGIFEGYLDAVATISNGSQLNTEQNYGTAGVWTNGTKSYLMTAEGFEYTQLIEKGLMCAVFMNQMTENYLQAVKTDDNTAIVDGKNYTAMQHHWDEAYGYFTSSADYPTSGTNRFWGKYANNLEDKLGSATKIAIAFRTGRAAIDNKDYAVRDAQIEIISKEIEKVCAATAIHYLNEAKTASDATIRNHVLSEARAFTSGLEYGPKSITVAKIKEALDLFSTDFEGASGTKIDGAVAIIAAGTGLEDMKSTL